jgi:hypothetical protein
MPTEDPRSWNPAVDVIQLTQDSLRVLLALAMSLLMCLAAQDYHVSPSGNDANPGSAAQPFQTIAQARNMVRGQTAGMTSDIHIILHEGWYIQASTLLFDQRDSGMNGFQVIYEAAPGDTPVISGGQRLAGWSLVDATRNIWSAPAPGLVTRQLYVNGQEAQRARSIGNPISGATQTATGYTLHGTSPLAGWGNIANVEFVYNAYQGGVTGGAQWSESRVDISSITVSGGQTVITMKQPAFMNATSLSWDAASFPTSVENAYALLDQPGEWYLDQQAGTMYYMPRVGESLSAAVVIAPVLETIVSGIGSAASPLTNIQFIGLTFAHGTWLRTNGSSGFPEYQANQTIDGAYVAGNVLFQHAHGVLIASCVFTHLGGAGLELSLGVQNSRVIGCRFGEIAGAGIVQGTITDPLRSDASLREDGNVIQDCSFSGIGNEYHGCAAIFNAYISNTLITCNQIVNAPYTAISIGWGWGTASYAKGNHITHNHVLGWMEQLADGGSWYALSAQPSSEVGWNWFQNQGILANGGCLYPDQGSSGWNIHDNVCDNVGNWLMIWTSSINAITTQNNWSNSASIVNLGTDITLTDNTLISGSNWPSAAVAIQTDAGLELAYAGVSSLTDGTMAVPSATASLTAAPMSVSAVSLGWSDVGGETGFLVERQSNGGPFVQVGQVGECAVNWSDSGLNADTTYAYRIRAFNSAGDSLYSSTASATTSPGPSTVPMPYVANAAQGVSIAVPGTTATVSVLGGPAAAEAGFLYTWTMVSGPAGGAVSFSPNGSHAARDATATFTTAGTFSVQVVIASTGGSVVSGPISITAVPTVTSVVVFGPALVGVGATVSFNARVEDQFANAMANQPSFSWTASGGMVSPSGLYTANGSPGSYQVTAAAGGNSGSAAVVVTTGGASAPSSGSSSSSSHCGLGSGFAAFLGMAFLLVASWMQSRRP